MKLTPHAPFPNIVVSYPGDRPREFFQPNELRVAFPSVDERSLDWLLTGQIVGFGVANCVDACLYTSDHCVRDAAADLLAACKAIVRDAGELRADHLDAIVDPASVRKAIAAIAKAEGGAA